MKKVNLSIYDNSWYQLGGNYFKRIIWYYINIIFFKNSWNPSSSIKVFFLRLFGAQVGKGVVIKPSVNIKYPWLLSIGDYVWIGEQVWIDNLANVIIENNVCISQGAMLLCGNHNYKKEGFDLIVGKIVLENGSWVGAKAIVCPGIKISSHAILSVNSVATQNMDAYSVYQGNPAVFVRKRNIS